MLPEFRWRNAGVMPEKMAEVKFAGKIQLAGDVLNGKPFIRQ
jgi:hypothetical protein